MHPKTASSRRTVRLIRRHDEQGAMNEHLCDQAPAAVLETERLAGKPMQMPNQA